MINLRGKLQNPFLLVGQGFLAGAVLFFAVSHETGAARSTPANGAPLQLEPRPAR